jgi:hypothetical protein
VRLSSGEQQILEAAKRQYGGFHLATQWYLRDWDPLGHQYVWHHCPIGNTTTIAGIASGKTSMVSASNTIDCLTYPGFRALNASVTAKQAELAYQMVESWRDGNPRLDKFIKNVVLRPYPIIEFTNSSTFEFRTAGQGAKFIRGSEYDRINYDEPQLDPTDEAIRTLRGRLRGRRPDGSVRMARLDCTGTPSYAPWIRERFYKGWRGSEYATAETLKYFWSLRIETYDNTRLTAEQIKLMETDYPPELIDVELRGLFPDYGLSMFPIKHITACTDASLNDEIDAALHPEEGSVLPGYDCVEWPRVGEIKLEFPFDPRRVYVMAGDPGVDNPPKRNSGVVMVYDVTEPPMKQLAYFHWVPGNGSYHPFMQSYKYANTKYRPVRRGIDATGPQKALDELGFQDFGLVLDNLNFGALKDGMLNALLVDTTNHTYRDPRIQGLIKQMSEYRREDDTPSKHIAQDLIMTKAQISWLARGIPEVAHSTGVPTANHRDRRQRTSVSSRRRSHVGR